MTQKYKINDIHIHLGPSNGMFQNLTVPGLLKYQKEYHIDHVAVMPLEIHTDRDNKKIINLAKKNKSVHGLFWIQKKRINEEEDSFLLRHYHPIGPIIYWNFFVLIS